MSGFDDEKLSIPCDDLSCRSCKKVGPRSYDDVVGERSDATDGRLLSLHDAAQIDESSISEEQDTTEPFWRPSKK